MENQTIKELKQEPRTNGTQSVARTATPEQFKKAHAKTSAQHAALFRRLAK